MVAHPGIFNILICHHRIHLNSPESCLRRKNVLNIPKETLEAYLQRKYSDPLADTLMGNSVNSIDHNLRKEHLTTLL